MFVTTYSHQVPIVARPTRAFCTESGSPVAEARKLWVRIRALLSRRRYDGDFKRFCSFVTAFRRDVRRPLRNGESQAMADDAVLLGLLDVDATFFIPSDQPKRYTVMPAYRRRWGARALFREWLVVHERRVPSNRPHLSQSTLRDDRRDSIYFTK
jgi:hypothetical protein